MNDHDDHREGLSHDLSGLLVRGLGRRRVFGVLGGLGAATLVACSADDGELRDVSSPTPTPGGASSATTSSATTSATVPEVAGEIPEETAGPFPGDGSNGPDVLSQSGVVRRDITRSFGTASGVADGVPLTIRLRVLDVRGDEVLPLAGAAVYLWQCDREGRYSMYTAGAEQENYLRGVQESDVDGWLEFRSIFPAAYPGRWPHAHFEVYPSLGDATTAGNRLRTSQLALPEEVCRVVYADAEGYGNSLDVLDDTPLEADGVFSDGWSLQLAKTTGSVAQGYTATLNVPV